MMQFSPLTFVSDGDDARQQVAQLRHVLAMVEEIAGSPSSSADACGEMDRISSAYHAAPAAVQTRFDALAAETTSWASVGFAALIGATQPSRAAARWLAIELTRAIHKLDRIVAA